MIFKHLMMTTSVCALVAAPALAQSRSFSDVDKNNDGLLSQAELRSAFGRRGGDAILSRSDLNGDGMVSAAEIQISRDDENEDRDDDESDDRDDDEGSENGDGADDSEGDDGGDDSEGDDE